MSSKNQVLKKSRCPNFSALRNASQSTKGREVESSNARSRDALHAATLQVPTMRISGLSVKATSLYSSFPRNFYLFRASLCPLFNKNLSYNVLEKTKISDSFPTTPHCHEGSPTHFCVIGLVSRGEREGESTRSGDFDKLEKDKCFRESFYGQLLVWRSVFSALFISNFILASLSNYRTPSFNNCRFYSRINVFLCRKPGMRKHCIISHGEDMEPVDISTEEKRREWDAIMGRCFPEFAYRTGFLVSTLCGSASTSVLS